jgi:hypothetical protein
VVEWLRDHAAAERLRDHAVVERLRDHAVVERLPAGRRGWSAKRQADRRSGHVAGDLRHRGCHVAGDLRHRGGHVAGHLRHGGGREGTGAPGRSGPDPWDTLDISLGRWNASHPKLAEGGVTCGRAATGSGRAGYRLIDVGRGHYVLTATGNALGD